MKIEKLVEKFKYSLELNNKSKDTVSAYMGDLNGLCGYLNSEGYADITLIDLMALNGYMAQFKGCKSSTINRKISTLKVFYKFLVQNGVVENNLAEQIDKPKTESKKPVIMSDADVQKVMTCCERVIDDGKNEQRDYAILKLLYNTGLRREELTNIKLDDLDLKQNRLLIHGKGSKERYSYLGNDVAFILSVYLKDCRPLFKNAAISDYLFMSQQTEKLSRGTVNNIINRYFEMAEVKVKNIGVHSTRKKFGTKAYQNTSDIYAVSQLLGHASVETTKRYVEIEESRMKRVATSVNF